MAVFRIVDGNVLKEADYRSKAQEIDDFLATRADAGDGSMDLGGGRRLTARAMTLESSPIALEGVTEFVPIAFGKPLTIEIRHIYTGKFPQKKLFDKTKDMAVVTGVKDYSVFAASARALNFLVDEVAAKSHHKAPSALSEGTSIIAYSPAIVTDSLTLTVEFAFDNFEGEWLTKLGGAFTSLAGVPIMLPHTGVLLAAGEVVKLAAGVGEALFDGRPDFSITESIDFDRPGSEVAVADFRLLSRDPALDKTYKYVDKTGLVHRETGAVYAGDEPYVVISLDGKKRPHLEQFAPSVASAAILKRFFDMKDGMSVITDAFVDGIKLASDMKFRQKAIDAKARLDATDEDDPDRAKLEAEYRGLLKNISNSLLVPAET